MKIKLLAISLFGLFVLTACLDRSNFSSALPDSDNESHGNTPLPPINSDSLYVVKAGLLIESGEYDEARICLQQAAKSNNIRIKAAYYFQMTILEEKLENMEAAYANFVEYHNYTEEIFQEENRALLEHEAKKEQLYYLFIVLLMLIFGVSLAFFYVFHKKKAKKQKEVQHLLDQYKNGEIQLNQLDQLIESKKSDSLKLTFLPYLIQADMFKETSLYAEIQNFGKQDKNKEAKVFNYQKQDQLQTELQKFFSTFDSDLKKCSSKLTEKDILLCCLSLLPINTFTKALCLGSTDTNIIKQRKFQIKKKMLEDSFGQLLFKFIFEKRSE